MYAKLREMAERAIIVRKRIEGLKNIMPIPIAFFKTIIYSTYI